MAESYSVKAILSAQDKGFTSGMKAAKKSLSGLKSTITGGLGFGIMSGIGMKAFDAISGGIGGIIGGMSEATATWKTFEANMAMTGKSDKQIARTKKSLQEFAQATIYSSSDMASTYAQLSAVGTKNTTKLVKGFGGLAAAAENPKQAMKTLSQQATQMAAKPAVQWQDFKLMMDQTPAGIAAVAKAMGKTTKELVKDVQDGTVATDDFFAAVAKVGTNKSFTKLAMQYKTVGEAMDGLTETASNKLQPAYEKLSAVGIAAISGITDAIDGIDGNALAGKVQDLIDGATPYWDSFKDHVVTVASAFGDAGAAIGDSLKKINEAAGNNGGLESFSSVLDTVAGVLTSFAGFLEQHSDAVAQVINHLPQLLAAYLAFRAVKAVAPGMMLFGRAIGAIGMAVGGKIASKLFGVGKGAAEVGKGGKKARVGLKRLAAQSTAFLKRSAGIALVVGSLAALALALKPLASLGSTAVAPLVTFGVVVGALAGVFANFGKALQKNAKGIATFAASISAMALAMAPLASTGTEGAIAMATFGVVVGALVAVFSIFGSALNAAIPGMLAFGATILMVGAGMALATPMIEALPPLVQQIGDTFSQVSGAVADAVSQIAESVGGVLCDVMQTAGDVVSEVATSISEGFSTVCDGVSGVVDAISGGISGVLDSVSGIIDSIGTAAQNAGDGFKSVAEGISMIADLSIADIATSLGAVAIGIGEIATHGDELAAAATGMQGISAAITASVMAVTALNVSFLGLQQTASATLTSVEAINTVFGGLKIPVLDVSPLISAFQQVSSASKAAASGILNAFDDTAGKAQSSGQKIGQNFTNGLRGQLQKSVSVSRQMANSVSSALASGQDRAYQSGVYIGQGFANGMRSMLGTVRAAAAELAAQADKAIAAKAKIGSPSKITTQYGKWWGIGYANGMHAMVGKVRAASAELVTPPAIGAPSMAATAGGSLPEAYEYGNATYTIIVPLEIDGREFARTTATYTKAELDTMQRRDDRRHGRA